MSSFERTTIWIDPEIDLAQSSWPTPASKRRRRSRMSISSCIAHQLTETETVTDTTTMYETNINVSMEAKDIMISWWLISSSRLVWMHQDVHGTLRMLKKSTIKTSSEYARVAMEKHAFQTALLRVSPFRHTWWEYVRVIDNICNLTYDCPELPHMGAQKWDIITPTSTGSSYHALLLWPQIGVSFWFMKSLYTILYYLCPLRNFYSIWFSVWHLSHHHPSCSSCFLRQNRKLHLSALMVGASSSSDGSQRIPVDVSRNAPVCPYESYEVLLKNLETDYWKHGSPHMVQRISMASEFECTFLQLLYQIPGSSLWLLTAWINCKIRAPPLATCNWGLNVSITSGQASPAPCASKSPCQSHAIFSNSKVRGKAIRFALMKQNTTSSKKLTKSSNIII